MAGEGAGPTIRQLDDRTIRQIAAGEVVERPASVVKELVENSLDAGASRVDVAVEGEHATARIAVEDDGHGIPRDQLEVAVGHHTTSKIAALDDIDRGPGSLGFRGEALHAIAQVGTMTIDSRPPGAPAGGRIVVEAGEVRDVEPAGVPEGTRVVVEDLFAPVPARRKFLDAPETERRRVRLAVERLALAHPEVAISLEVDGRRRFATPGDGDRRAAVGAVHGRDVATAMLELEAPAELPAGLEGVEGLVSDPETARTDPAVVTTVLNGRPIDDVGVRRAVVDAYGDRLAPDRYPFAVVVLEVAPDRIDVNVHPRKHTVHFEDGDAVVDAVEATVRDALDRDAPLPSGPPRAGGSARSSGGPRPAIDLGALSTGGTQATLPGTAEPAAEDAFDRLPALRVVGQVHDAYVVAESPDGGIVLVDQHAADERIRYERLKEAVAADRQHQRLAAPAEVSLTPAELDALETAREPVEDLGFRFRVVDDRTARVTAVPAVVGTTLPPADLERAIRLVLRNALDEDGGVLALADPLLADLACHPAITANEPLTEGAIAGLLRELDRCESPWTCPHGRPTMIELSGDELDERFERDYPGARPCRRWDEPAAEPSD
ncbi:MAG: DNA mismatch repair endonuclease MutL [Halobacteriales archaeon]